MSSLENWVSDNLITLLGNSKPIDVSYVITMSEKASSAVEIINELLKMGMSSCPETISFAREIFARVEHKSSRPNPDQEEGMSDRRETEEFVRHSRKHDEVKTSRSVFEGQIDFVKASVMEAVIADKYTELLLKHVKEHRVLVIVVETGCEITEQIPQYLIDAGYSRMRKILCIQPDASTSDNTLVKVMKPEMALREAIENRFHVGYSAIIMDASHHERAVSTDVLLGLLKDIRHCRLLIVCTLNDSEKFSNYFNSAPIFKIPGRRFPVEIHHVTAPEDNVVNAAITAALQLHVSQAPGDGDILIILTGKEDIKMVEETIKERMTRGGSCRKIPQLIICPFYANLPTELRDRLFKPNPRGVRRVILSTGISETSLKLDGIKYVIDMGASTMESYCHQTGIKSLVGTRISRASADERAALSGRSGPGQCFRMYTAYQFWRFDDNTVPTIRRFNLVSVFLMLKEIGIMKMLEFDFIDPPRSEDVMKALKMIHDLGALNEKGELSKTGRMMVESPVDPMLTRMVVASEEYECSDEIITVAAMVSVGNSLFDHPKGREAAAADKARSKFYKGNLGDHLAFLKVYNEWKENNFSIRWCEANFIKVDSIKKASSIRNRLEEMLEKFEIEQTSTADLDRLRKCIVSGFFVNAAKLTDAGVYNTIKYAAGTHLRIHPSSGLVKKGAPPKWVVYHEAVRTDHDHEAYMLYLTVIEPIWLPKIAPHVYQSKDVEDPSWKKVPRGKGRAIMD